MQVEKLISDGKYIIIQDLRGSHLLIMNVIYFLIEYEDFALSMSY